MGIQVQTFDGAKHLYTDATGWHVDDYGFLFLRGANGGGNVAAFSKGVWQWVAVKHG